MNGLNFASRHALTRAVARVVLLLFLVAPGLGFAAVASPQHDIEVVLAVDSGEIRITDRVRVAQRQHYRFQLAPWLNLDEVRLNGELAQVRRDGNGYHIELARGDENELVFALSGTVPARAGARPDIRRRTRA